MFLPRRVRRTKHVTTTLPSSPVIDLTPSAYFSAHFYRAVAGATTERLQHSGSPRSTVPRHRLRYVASTVTPTIYPGDRVGVDLVPEVTYEVVSTPMLLREGVPRYEVELASPAELYPESLSLELQGGTVVDAAVPCAVWMLDEPKADDAGRHYELAGDAPIDYATVLQTSGNRQLKAGTRRFQIVNAIVHRDVPHVELRLRE